MRGKKILLLTLGESINLILGFLLVPFLARTLSLEEYGTYAQAILVISTILKFLGFGFSKVLFADLADEKLESSSTVRSNLFLVLCFGLFGTLISFLTINIIVSYFNNSELYTLVPIYSLSIPLSLLYASCMAVLVYFEKVKRTVYISVFTNLLRLALIFFFIQVFYSIKWIFISLLLVSLLQAVWSYFSIPSILRKKGLISKKILFGQISSGVPLGLTIVISTIFYSLDSFMVSNMLGVEKFAIFTNGCIYIPIIATLYGSVNTIILPDISKLYGRGELTKIAGLKKRAMHNTAGLIYPIIIFFVVFSKILIPLYLSSKYHDSYLVFAIFNIALLFRITSYDDIFIASKKSSQLPRKYLIALICNTILNYVLINIFGINGAVLASLLSFIILILLLINGGLKILGLRLSKLLSIRKLGITALLPLVCSVCFLILYKALPYPVLIILYGGIYLLLIYHIFIIQDLIEKKIIGNILSKYSYLNSFFQRIYLPNQI